MIKEDSAYAFCIEDIKNIENYDKAMADTTQTWACHHKLEVHSDYANSMKDMKLMNLYYHRPASELIFLPVKEHDLLHRRNRSLATRARLSESNKGKSKSDETKAKLKEAWIKRKQRTRTWIVIDGHRKWTEE